MLYSTNFSDYNFCDDNYKFVVRTARQEFECTERFLLRLKISLRPVRKTAAVGAAFNYATRLQVRVTVIVGLISC
jgi:hypothetical protein